MKKPSEWIEVPGVWMRGGTSKCWIFDADHMLAAELPIDTMLEEAFGSGDARQIDGVGGGTSTTSKAMIVRTSDTPGIDVNYTFAQVGIADRVVEWGSNCGNCATAIGLYAVQQGLVAPEAAETTVRMLNTNTQTRLDAIVATPGGRVPHTGTATVPGVATGGVPVRLRFVSPLSGRGRALLPTGEPRTTLHVGERTIPLTIVDAGAVAALIDGAALGLHGDETLDEVAGVISLLIDVRRQASVAAGLTPTIEQARDAVPKVGFVTPPVDYRTTDGHAVSAADYDLAVRMVSMHQPHPAIGLTSAVAVAVATSMEGSIPHAVSGGGIRGLLRIGTPSGVVPIEIERDDAGEIIGVSLRRAARRLSTAQLEIARPAEAHGGDASPRRTVDTRR